MTSVAEVIRPCHDNLTLVEVATRLRKSKRWLQAKLADDRRRPPTQRRFQYHARIGRTPVWTEAQYLALRDALKAESAESPDFVVVERCGFWHIHGTVIAQGRRVRVRKSTHLEALPADGQKQMPSGTGSRRKSGANSAAKSGQVLTFRSPQNST